MLTGIHARMTSTRIRQFGFSFLELMIALSISAILLAMALPSLQSFVGESEITTTSNNFVHSLQTARSEAIKRAGPVGVCPSLAPLADEPSCGGDDYTNGWIVFSDDNGNGSRDNTDQVILQTGERSPAFTFTPDAVFAQRIYFGESGTSINPAGIPLSGGVRIEFSSNEAREISIAANGRITTADPNDIGAP